MKDLKNKKRKWVIGVLKYFRKMFFLLCKLMSELSIFEWVFCCLSIGNIIVDVVKYFFWGLWNGLFVVLNVGKECCEWSVWWDKNVVSKVLGIKCCKVLLFFDWVLGWVSDCVKGKWMM